MTAGPIAIGAVGGSGTRVVADAFRRAGVEMGRWHNESLDTLACTYLLVRPELRDGLTPARTRSRIDALARYLSGSRLRPADVAHICAEIARSDRHRIAGRLRSFVSTTPTRRRTDHATAERWGWKEPNTHLFLAPLADNLPDLVYIHVIRHGLDMAFSANVNQGRDARARFGLDDGDSLDPPLLLEYWIRANTAAIETGRAALGDRFRLCIYEELVDRPAEKLEQLFEATGVEFDDGVVKDLAAGIRPNPGIGRYRTEDLAQFTPDQLDAVRLLGFDMDSA